MAIATPMRNSRDGIVELKGEAANHGIRVGVREDMLFEMKYKVAFECAGRNIVLDVSRDPLRDPRGRFSRRDVLDAMQDLINKERAIDALEGR